MHIVTYTLLLPKGPPLIVGLALPVAIQRATLPVLTRAPVMSVSNKVVVTAPMSVVAATASLATMLMGDCISVVAPVPHAAAPVRVFQSAGATLIARV